MGGGNILKVYSNQTLITNMAECKASGYTEIVIIQCEQLWTPMEYAKSKFQINNKVIVTAKERFYHVTESSCLILNKGL